MQPLSQRAVRRNADRLALGSIGDQLGVLVPVRLAEAEPVHLAAGSAIAVEVRKGAFGVAVLPGVEATLLAVLQKLDNALRRVPGFLVLAQESVKMRVAINRIAADDEPGYAMRAQRDAGEQRLRGCCRPGGIRFR